MSDAQPDSRLSCWLAGQAPRGVGWTLVPASRAREERLGLRLTLHADRGVGRLTLETESDVLCFVCDPEQLEATAEVLRLGTRRYRWSGGPESEVLLHALRGSVHVRCSDEEAPVRLAPGEACRVRASPRGTELECRGHTERAILGLVHVRPRSR